jgi:hypothetical protein
MRWMPSGFIRSGVHSLQGLLAHYVSFAPREVYRLEDIRHAMLKCLEEQCGARFPQIERRISFAQDLQVLWYLRSDMMSAISSLRGETFASQRLRQITSMFEIADKRFVRMIHQMPHRGTTKPQTLRR